MENGAPHILTAYTRHRLHFRALPKPPPTACIPVHYARPYSYIIHPQKYNTATALFATFSNTFRPPLYNKEQPPRHRACIGFARLALVFVSKKTHFFCADFQAVRAKNHFDKHFFCPKIWRYREKVVPLQRQTFRAVRGG